MLNDRLDEYMNSEWYNSDNSFMQGYICVFNTTVDCGNGTPNGQSLWVGQNGIQSPIIGTWFRKEVYWRYGVTNGDFVERIFRNPGNEGAITIKDWTGIAANPPLNTKRYFTFQNYVGDSVPDTMDKRNINIYIDDVFIQTGTQARVELCDSSTWSSRKHCEIQYPSAWADGSISIQFNQGAFGAGNAAYLYVVDSSGNVNSSGYKVTISPPSGNTTPPSPPRNFRMSSN